MTDFTKKEYKLEKALATIENNLKEFYERQNQINDSIENLETMRFALRESLFKVRSILEKKKKIQEKNKENNLKS